ncbi:hypothetical protein DPMN_033856, partial [Dreissena polymorpha]
MRTNLYQHGKSRQNTRSTRRPHGLSRNNMAEIQIAPSKHRPSRHSQRSSRTYTKMTRIFTKEIRTKHGMPRTDIY